MLLSLFFPPRFRVGIPKSYYDRKWIPSTLAHWFYMPVLGHPKVGNFPSESIWWHLNKEKLKGFSSPMWIPYIQNRVYPGMWRTGLFGLVGQSAPQITSVCNLWCGLVPSAVGSRREGLISRSRSHISPPHGPHPDSRHLDKRVRSFAILSNLFTKKLDFFSICIITF